MIICAPDRAKIILGRPGAAIYPGRPARPGPSPGRTSWLPGASESTGLEERESPRSATTSRGHLDPLGTAAGCAPRNQQGRYAFHASQRRVNGLAAVDV